MIVLYFSFCEFSVFSAFLLSKLPPLFFNFSKNTFYSIDGIFKHEILSLLLKKKKKKILSLLILSKIKNIVLK